MKSVAILTAAYPFLPGEQFIEDEIAYWATQTAAKVTLVPMTAVGVPRDLPNGIETDLTLSKDNTQYKKILYLFVTIFSNVFWKEVKFVFLSNGPNIGCLWQALLSTSRVLRVENALRRFCVARGGIDVMYCYWNEAQAYAAVRLKRQKLVARVVSRAHGWDVYQERRTNNYMPLKRQFINELDAIYAISMEGKRYLENTYNLSSNNVCISRLGVPVPEEFSLSSPINCLNILSISFCNSVKRIDKIIDAISLAAGKLDEVNIAWTHIGDGPLLMDLKTHAAEKLKTGKIKYQFPGLLENAEVKKYFKNNNVDFFINASESEGVPVTIMEAMSYGVPVIAPDVGGISEIVSAANGVLLKTNTEVAEIAEAILYLFPISKKMEFRSAAKQKIILDYSAVNNYSSLIELVVN